MRLTPQRLLAFALLATVAGLAAGQEAPARASVDCDFAVLEDKTQQLPAESVTDGSRDAAFTLLPQNRGNYGYTTSAFWVKATCRDKGIRKLIVVLDEALLDYVDVYSVRGAKPLYHLGDTTPFAERPVAYRMPAFPTLAPKGGERTTYLRIQTEGTVQLSFRPMAEADFISMVSADYVFFGCYFGVLLAMVFLNAALAATLREVVYVTYTGYVVALGVFLATADGLAFQFLWPGSPWLANFAAYFWAAVARAFSFAFVRAYLETRTRMPRWDVALRIGFWMSVVMACVDDFLPRHIVNAFMPPVSLAFTALQIAVGVQSLRRGYPHSRIYMAAWGTFLIGVLVFSTRNSALLPTNVFTQHAMQLGSAVELLLLSIGVVQRLRAAESAHHAAKTRMLELEVETRGQQAVLKMARLMAHDVRAPFSLVELAIARMRAAPSMTEVQDVLDKLQPPLRKASASVNGMIADVLELGAPADLQPESTAEVLLDALIAASLADVFLLFPTTTLDFAYDLAHTLAVDGNAKRLQRVLDNIIQNAVQALLPGGHIWFTSRDVSGFVELVIGNERSFIPPADLELVFEPYYTRGKPRGTGLGLALARKVIHEHGGRIECRSEYGHGTEFVLRLPAAPRAKAESDVQLPESSAASAALIG